MVSLGSRLDPSGLTYTRIVHHREVRYHSQGMILPACPRGGFGFGATFLGAFRTLSALALPHERAELFAAVYVVRYLAFSVPAVAAGLATSDYGLRPTATVYGLVVIALSLVVVAGRPSRRRQLA